MSAQGHLLGWPQTSGPTLPKTTEETKSTKVDSGRQSVPRKDKVVLNTEMSWGPGKIPHALGILGCRRAKTEGKFRQSPGIQVSKGYMGL